MGGGTGHGARKGLIGWPPRIWANQAPEVRGIRDWLPGPGSGPAPRDAKGHPEPGCPGTLESSVSSEPGAGGAAAHARASALAVKMAARVLAGRFPVTSHLSRHSLAINPHRRSSSLLSRHFRPAGAVSPSFVLSISPRFPR